MSPTCEWRHTDHLRIFSVCQFSILQRLRLKEVQLQKVSPALKHNTAADKRVPNTEDRRSLVGLTIISSINTCPLPASSVYTQCSCKDVSFNTLDDQKQEWSDKNKSLLGDWHYSLGGGIQNNLAVTLSSLLLKGKVHFRGSPRRLMKLIKSGLSST